ncbi:hypothetical protein [Hydrogenophaga sp.]|uniref:hypothetical protein n=1 Tax=Hydrogenophaga sp. TaxID=1904254 RepID=UPI0027328A26|nr:hypothetical protein [Hydrogenophaga sp.]MDP3887205.1 hypothetical protein [Hydrogenophaga sp.]MDZ4358122.1 hypothetical protein [Variovorax sp.]
MSLDLHGLVLTPLPEPNSFAYRPARPTLARNDDGSAQFSFIKAGSVNLLSFTAVWEAPQAALDQARADLAAQQHCAPDKIDLLPDPLIASPAELRFGDGAGQWVTAVSTASSGVAPFQAAFSAMLNPEQADKLRQAAAGETGWVGVAYRLTLADAPVRSSTLDAQASFLGEASLNRGDPQDPTVGLRTEASASLSATHSSSPAAPAPDESFGDAALWGLPKP